MRGMNKDTGRAIAGHAHLYQSIARILTTPTDSRLVVRPFGSELMFLIDAPTNPATRVRLFAAVATALMKWEPRVRVTRVWVSLEQTVPGQLVVGIEGTARAGGLPISTNVTLEGLA